MHIELDYETICMNCQEKGYSFGYTIKKITYKKAIAMDIPTQYLNGACVSFNYNNIPFLLKSTESSYSLDFENKNPNFLMINAKKNQSGMISRFTYRLLPDLHPLLKNQAQQLINFKSNHLLEFLDIYRFENAPYFFIFYSFCNNTNKTLENFNFYQLYDFDIYGEERFDNDCAIYDVENQIIYQYDADLGKNKSLIAGFGSNPKNKPIHFECNSPQNIFISPEHPNLKNIPHYGPHDCAIALQWKQNIKPNEVVTYPIMMIFGLGQKLFYHNLKLAQNHLEKIQKHFPNVLQNTPRQEIDQKLLKLSFSKREWCK